MKGGYRMKNQKNIYFVQAGNLFGRNVYLPYAAGCVAAYAWNNPVIQKNYRLGRFIFLREPVAEVIASLEEPFLIAFSNYAWNFEYHKTLAKAVKERWPDCLILFGGHQISNESFSQLNEYPFVDFLVHKAGEIPFELLLLALLQDEDLNGVPSLSYRDPDGKPMHTKEGTCERCDFPSPYHVGLFDGLMEEYPDFLFSMIIETNRGCPYSCSYCDWGTIRHALHVIPMERVKTEIDWAARHKIEYVYCSDANFGILERDEAIVDYLIESKRRTDYPKKFSTCFARESNEAVLRLNQKLSAHGLNNGASLSLQSLSPAALKNIGRKNLDIQRFRELVSLYNQANVPVYSELIVGLPGESLDSFSHGIGALLAAGMHGALEIYLCELLPNAELSSPFLRKTHDIGSIRVQRFPRYGLPEAYDEVPEYAEYICQTSTMPAEDWIAANLFSTVVQAFHGLGLLSFCAVYLFWERQLPYERFYFDLIDYARENPSALLGELLLLFEGQYQSLLQGDGAKLVYYDPRFGEIAWPLGGAMFLCAAFESERLYAELPAFLRRYTIDTEILSQLLRYQRTMVLLPASPPPRQTFAFDFPGFFSAAFAGKPPTLDKKTTTVTFPEQTPSLCWEDFARERVWYDRRKGLLERKGCKVSYE